MDGVFSRKLLTVAAMAFGWAGLAAFTAPSAASAAPFIELSAMGSYGRSTVADGYSSRQWRYTGSLGFKLSAVSSIEFDYTETTTKVEFPTRIGTLLPTPTMQYIDYIDKVYSASWVQNLVPSDWIIQPYVKVGGGKLYRKQITRFPEYDVTITESQSSTTGVGGVGLRIFLTRRIALKGEFNSYVPNFQASKWKENQLFSVGLSWVL